MKGRVIVVGAGVAGCAVAHMLADAGREVLVLDQATVASGGSGNPAGLSAPYPCPCGYPDAPYHEAVLESAKDFFGQHEKELPFVRKCGALQLPSRQRVEEMIQSKAPLIGGTVVSAAEATELAGIPILNEALYFSDSWLIDPRALCRWYLRNAEVRECEAIISMDRHHERWVLRSPTHTYEASTVIVATAWNSPEFSPLSWLALEPVKGHIVTIPYEKLPSLPCCAICFDGYLLPPIAEDVVIGAAYEHRVSDPRPSSNQVEGILRRLSRALPLFSSITLGEVQVRASFRASTFDRFPYVGQIPDLNRFPKDWRICSKVPSVELPRIPGLYCSVGHGSRGISSSIASARYLAALITGEGSHGFLGFAPFVDPIRLALRTIKTGLSKQVTC